MVKGWWRISVRMTTLRKLESLKKELFGFNDIGLDKVIQKLIKEYERLKKIEAEYLKLKQQSETQN